VGGDSDRSLTLMHFSTGISYQGACVLQREIRFGCCCTFIVHPFVLDPSSCGSDIAETMPVEEDEQVAATLYAEIGIIEEVQILQIERAGHIW
jgi:hypothetical protein